MGAALRRIGVFALISATLFVGSPAFAYVDRGTDPAEGESIDVLASVRTVKLTDHGRQLFLRVLYDAKFDGFNYWIRLDTRGDERADFRVWVDNTEGPTVCEVHRVGYPGIIARCEGRERSLGSGPRRVVLREHVGLFHPTKDIQWSIFAPRLYSEDDVPDRAPDTGWYP